jgi:hypothetical protein
VSEIRRGLLVGLDAAAVATCLFCGTRVSHGALWLGPSEYAVCRGCVLRGELGKLVGDALDTCAEVERALLASERHAFRSLALANERRRES